MHWEHQGSQLLLLGTYYLLSSSHLGRELSAPGWMRLPRGRVQHDTVLLNYADPHPTEKMEDQKALQATKTPDSSSVLGRLKSLTTASSRSSIFILLRLGTQVTNTTSVTCLYGQGFLTPVLCEKFSHYHRKKLEAGCQWLTPVILATQEAEIRRIMVCRQPRQMVFESIS
jgi:hypothetical protein